MFKTHTSPETKYFPTPFSFSLALSSSLRFLFEEVLKFNTAIIFSLFFCFCFFFGGGGVDYKKLCIRQFQQCQSAPMSNCTAIAYFISLGGRALSYPGATQAFHTYVVSDSKSRPGGFYRKRLVVCQQSTCPSSTGQNCGGF